MSHNIVIPITKIKTKSGRSAEEVLGDSDIQPVEPAEENEVGRDLRIIDGKVLIKFPKFVNLIVMHDFEDVMKKHADADIVISSDLLVDLANAHDEVEQPLPWGYLIAGVVLGVVGVILLSQINL
ncbi:hypothetical protein COV81_00845 [Candidatus Peregrinibacteria bacterium CG11_big_fil_rev_8_21_14_0_20_41_10]|nr:MAG: hypothetical protein COV81_00845 [Candidatus Peregrinibacteria bacterium CG11_big_fil_rev_8_21_14_0_20_41_10]PIZ73906.1 MAG: hypothetical protein COY06_04905 [Candidatus Peregrinibacteria bacterium CG_4_10_14_0_2_um_filter_41_8]